MRLIYNWNQIEHGICEWKCVTYIYAKITCVGFALVSSIINIAICEIIDKI